MDIDKFNIAYNGYHRSATGEEDAELTHSDPGTPCGEYLRLFWQPVCMSEQLTDLPLGVRIMGEDLVVFRDLSGDVGLLHRQCSHRRTSLEYGVIAEHGIRCCYHGWLFDVDGTILETPGEPEDSLIRHTLAHGAYPAHEYKGLVFAYFGPPELKPVPRVLGRLPRLTRIGLKSNAIAEIAPDALPPTVEHLILTDNRLTALPPALFARLANVRKLMLANNALASLPAEVAHMRSLELVRLSNNRLSSLPAELLALPKLAWLALSGNPLSPPPPPPVAPTAAEAEIVVDESAGGKLGEGASGAVRAGTFRGAPVAIKGFKAVSSDGRAEDEVALYAALAHPSIVACVGVLREPRLALLLERLPPTTRDLAGPPTIVEVIEDRYGDAWSGSTFPARFASRVARAVGRALAHLHSQRVAHGDVYGHNTLVLDADAAGVRLGDFGAAYSYRGLAASSVERGGAFGDEVFELIEVRAYGTLLGELATHSAADSARAPRTHVWLRDASRRCLVPDVLQRPRFATLAAEMAELFEDGAALKK